MVYDKTKFGNICLERNQGYLQNKLKVMRMTFIEVKGEQRSNVVNNVILLPKSFRRSKVDNMQIMNVYECNGTNIFMR